MNIGPRPDGTFEPIVVSNMREVGAWVKAHADAIYDTRGGSFVEEGQFTSTQKGKTTNLFVFDNSIEQLVLKNSKEKVISVKDEKGKLIDFQQVDGNVTLKIGKSDVKEFVKGYKLLFQ